MRSGDVHLWRAGLAPAEEVTDGLAVLLSEDEQQRADRFHRSADGRRFVVARGLLRLLLGRYLGLEPASVSLTYGGQGKPELSPRHVPSDLRFNVAHSGDVALYALARGRRVGVDLERVRPVRDLEEVARIAFSARERRELRGHPAAERTEAFLRGWSRKEAVVKALGEGLRRPLDRIEVGLGTSGEPLLRALDGDRCTALQWSLRDVTMETGYVAAVAVERGEASCLKRASRCEQACADRIDPCDAGRINLGGRPSQAP